MNLFNSFWQRIFTRADLATNLLSVSTICKRGHKMIFTADKCEVWDEDGELVITGVEDSGLYRVKRQENAFLANEIEPWHRRLGHINEASLKKLKQIASGIEFGNETLTSCVSYLEGKQVRQPFPSSELRSEELLQLVHSDLCGPIEVSSKGGSRYFMSFVDDASRKVNVFFLRSKNQAFGAFKIFKAKAEKQTGKQIKILRSDNGTEYVNGEFRQLFEAEGIRHQTTCPYTPQQNGVAERMNRTLVEKARCLLNDAKLSKEFWAEAISTAA